MRLTRQLQFFKIKQVIRVRAKNRAAIIATHNHMLRLIGNNQSGQASHDSPLKISEMAG
jgi:hypothetical protein